MGEAWDGGIVGEPIVVLDAGGEFLHARGHVGVAFGEGGVCVGDEVVEVMEGVWWMGVVVVVGEGWPIFSEEVVV